jgi:hypothetical protein
MRTSVAQIERRHAHDSGMPGFVLKWVREIAQPLNNTVLRRSVRKVRALWRGVLRRISKNGAGERPSYRREQQDLHS